MDNIFSKFVAKLVATWLDRVCGGWATTVAGILGATAVALGAYAPIVPAKWQPLLIGVGALLAAVAAAMGYGPKGASTVTKVGILFLVLCLAPAVVQAQSDPAPTSATPASLFTASSEATALYYVGQWGAATHITESFDLLDFGKSKASSIILEGHEIVAAPRPGSTPTSEACASSPT